MDKKLFSELLSVIKLFEEKHILIEILKCQHLTKKQREILTYKDKKTVVAQKIQTNAQLNNNYSIKYAPTIHQILYYHLILNKDYKLSLLIATKLNLPRFKVIALFMIFFKEKDVKFLAAAVQISREMKFRKFSVFGSSLLAKYSQSGGDQFIRLSVNDDYEFASETNIPEL